jgi:predicted O-methyltransferase YrrM
MKNFFEQQKQTCSWPKLYYGVFSSIINENNYKKVLEVGCAYGFHTKQVLSNTGIESYTMVDPYVPYSSNIFSDSVQNVFRDEKETISNFDQFVNIVMEELSEYKEKITHIRKPSIEATKDVEDESFDAIFIDGDHSYQAVKEDLSVWWPKLRVGGTLCGDDYWMSDVARAVHEFASVHGLEVKFKTREDNDYKIFYITK